MIRASLVLVATSVVLAACAPSGQVTRAERAAPPQSVHECVNAYYPVSPAPRRPSASPRHRSGSGSVRLGGTLAVSSGDLDGKEAIAVLMLVAAAMNTDRFWLKRCLRELRPTDEQLIDYYASLEPFSDRNRAAKRAQFGLYSVLSDEQKALADDAVAELATDRSPT